MQGEVHKMLSKNNTEYDCKSRSNMLCSLISVCIGRPFIV